MNRVGAATVSPVMEAGIKQAWWRWARPLGGALILGVLLVRLGGGPFIEGVRAVDARTLALAVCIAVVTTAAAAWRWSLVAHGLRAELPLASAIVACYRAQFLNVTLPGGVIGDVDRGVRHGRELDDVGRGLRAVMWERAAGQVVLAVVTVAVVALSRPFAATVPILPMWALAALVAAALTAAVVLARSGLGMRAVRVALSDLRGLAQPGRLGGVVLASLAVLAGHLVTLWLAARTVGVRMPLIELLPVALLILVVAAVPVNLAGWGPREGAAAWAFAGMGLGASQGLAVAVAYGAMVFVATLPGAVLLITGRSRRRSREVATDG